MNHEDIKGLEAAGLHPVIVDENTTFPETLLFPSPFKSSDALVDVIPIDTRSEDEVNENFKEDDYPLVLDTDSKTPKHKGYGARNKAAGHGWERELVNRLIKIGFVNVGTSRNISRTRDAEKVDIMNRDERTYGFLPFNIQAKTESRTTNFQKHLAEMPKNPNTVNVVVFKQTSKATSKFMKVGEYAIMFLNDWFYYIEVEKELKDARKIIEELTLQLNLARKDYQDLRDRNQAAML